ncbi:MAG: response regulator [Chloroflexi bacterium]|nr:response regulator [Chloroflexota bacterium]MBM4450128.1 response regulator [Chloroflexota bacterium]
MNKGNAKASILIVDDESSVRGIILRKLTQVGYYCDEAANGNIALKKIDERDFDLVLLDISMPVKSGTEVLQEIASKYPDIAVIMVTAISNVETAIQSMKLGAYDYIIKPVELNILMLSVNRALEKRRLVRENRDYQLHLEKKVQEQTEKIRESFLNSIMSLAVALEAKDEYTRGHSERVTSSAVVIAREMGLPDEMVEKIRLASLVHDIGKIGVSESILGKPGKLTEDEYRHVMAHCEIGERILRPIVEDEEILEMVRHHHERYDGTGYPDGLAADPNANGARSSKQSGDPVMKRFSVGSRLLAVIDAYDAMTSNRPYRKALDIEVARAEMEKGKGRQFDPKIVDIFLRVSDGLVAGHQKRSHADKLT